MSFNTFSNNIASIEGGAFKYVETAPVFLTQNNVFVGETNNAIYGPNYAAYSVKMRLKIFEPLGDDINLAKMSIFFLTGKRYYFFEKLKTIPYCMILQ
jgi:hypothetical protein